MKTGRLTWTNRLKRVSWHSNPNPTSNDGISQFQHSHKTKKVPSSWRNCQFFTVINFQFVLKRVSDMSQSLRMLRKSTNQRNIKIESSLRRSTDSSMDDTNVHRAARRHNFWTSRHGFAYFPPHAIVIYLYVRLAPTQSAVLASGTWYLLNKSAVNPFHLEKPYFHEWMEPELFIYVSALNSPETSSSFCVCAWVWHGASLAWRTLLRHLCRCFIYLVSGSLGRSTQWQCIGTHFHCRNEMETENECAPD